MPVVGVETPDDPSQEEPLSPNSTILLAPRSDAMQRLADALEAELVPLPPVSDREDFEEWRDGVAAGRAVAHVIVAVWSEGEAPDPLLELDESAWTRRLEGPFLLWNLALGAAAARCDDGGSIVALVQSPSALDAAGFTPEAAIGDGVVALIRSVAASEGPRGVRANAVTTPLRLVERATLAPAPPLPGYPGRIDVEVAGAIRMLLSEDACGLTGRVLAADGGRTLT